MSKRLETITIVAGTYDKAVMEVKSASDPEVTYKVDTVNGRCSCPAWKFSRNGTRTCKHLVALGIESYQGGSGTLIKTPKGL
jgi:uncharacterized Zn finger protein